MNRGLRHLALKTRDLGRTERFYTDVLGLRQAFPHRGMLFLETPGGEDLLNFVETRRKFDPAAGGLDHFGLQVPRSQWKSVRARVERLYLGGRSMGGRIASHVVADGLPSLGLVFLSYPLHPPGQPQRLRATHLQKISVPMLFLHGTRDAFATPALLRQVLVTLPTATLHDVEGADHGLTVRGRDPEDVTRELTEITRRWMVDPQGPRQRK